MSGSNRSKHPKFGLIIGIAVSILISAAFIGWGLSQSAEYQRQADEQSAEYSADTYQKVAQACVGVAPPEKVQCITDARHERRANEREEQDLVAQRQSALWAYIMGAAAVIGMGLSIIGVFLVYTTFAETREANVIARNEAERASKDAYETRQAFIQSERAIVSVVSMTAHLPSAEAITTAAIASVRIINRGKTNAHNMRLFYTLAEDPTYRHRLPNVRHLAEIAIPGSDQMLGQIKIRKGRKLPCYVVGFIEYSTIYGATFKSYFCCELSSLPEQSVFGGTEAPLMQSVACKNMPANT